MWPAALIITFVIAAGIPTANFVMRRAEVVGKANTIALEIADDLREIVADDPSEWRAPARRHIDIVSEALARRGVARVRALDDRGAVVAVQGAVHEAAWWTVTGSAPIAVKGRGMGRIDVAISQAIALGDEVVVFAVAGLLGLVLGASPMAIPSASPAPCSVRPRASSTRPSSA